MTALHRHSYGFTLLEVLVAITLLSVVAALLAGGLRFGTRVWHQGEDQLQALAGMQSVHGLMRRQLAQAVPLMAPDRLDDQIVFEGMPTYLRFVGAAPAQPMVGGYYEITFGLSNDKVTQHLMMAWRLLADSKDGTRDTVERDQVLLLPDVAEVSFAYFGGNDDEAPHWQESWVDKPMLPHLVRVIVSFKEGDPRLWPDLVVQPMVHLPAEQPT